MKNQIQALTKQGSSNTILEEIHSESNEISFDSNEVQ